MITIFVITLFLLALMIVLAVHSAFVYKKALDLNPKVLELAELERKIETAKDMNSQLAVEYNNLLDSKNKAEEIIANGEAAKKFLDENEDKIKEMKDLQEDIQNSIDDLENKREEKNKLYKELQQQYTDINRDIDECNIQLENLKKDIDSKSRELRDIESRITTKTKDEEALDEKLKAKRQERDSLNQECAEYESKKRELSELESQISDLKNDKSTLVSEVRELEKQRDYLRKYHETEDELVEKINSLKDELKTIEDDISTKKAERDSLYQECSGYEMTKKQFEELQGKVEDLNQEKSKLENTVKELKKEKEELLKYSETEQDIKNRIDISSEKLKDLEKEIREKERELGAFDERESAFKQLGVDIESLKNQKLKLEGDIESLKSQKVKEEESEKRLKEMEAHIWDDLDRPVINMPNVISKKNISETSKLNEFKANLEDCDIVFDPRIINAFHTGLKAADSSPLVVLSGISGTGKSLLPQLYAAAMGMNFLSVAVQPRWDSPQDMFGFFNYMQSKFKATELSRMLWQFDIYNNVEGEDSAYARYKKEGNLPMNIVLFDEMNLARVEYYFSDMLSKLEIRRNINDASSSRDRASAEIEIEGGSISMKDNARRLYVNKNTLFVGTMNEDETTQSLSDKVMDRSNVLRFGKPKNLVAKPNVPKFFECYSERKDYLSYDNWISMDASESFPANLHDKLDDKIRNINDVMDSIDRPFAYRVSKAIHSYVSAYPNAGTSTLAYNNALADQIEMKVLPKLNGLDITVKKNKDAMDRIQSLISDVKDEDNQLLTAFSKNLKDTEVFFKWKGVVR